MVELVKETPPGENGYPIDVQSGKAHWEASVARAKTSWRRNGMGVVRRIALAVRIMAEGVPGHHPGLAFEATMHAVFPRLATEGGFRDRFSGDVADRTGETGSRGADVDRAVKQWVRDEIRLPRQAAWQVLTDRAAAAVAEFAFYAEHRLTGRSSQPAKKRALPDELLKQAERVLGLMDWKANEARVERLVQDKGPEIHEAVAERGYPGLVAFADKHGMDTDIQRAKVLAAIEKTGVEVEQLREQWRDQARQPIQPTPFRARSQDQGERRGMDHGR